ncbi:hypothetical protein [Rhizobium aegyptiacum]|uniref:hypothetical protein n=1 Tax=Rhizobium aegyptiacum TaxID=1764550 RepID=UPI0007E551EF|nr:hypothetical protein [Rhizobium aegyptiacum]
MLSVAPEDVAIAHSISEIGTLPVTCVVECSTPEEYSQLITICLSEILGCHSAQTSRAARQPAERRRPAELISSNVRQMAFPAA